MLYIRKTISTIVLVLLTLATNNAIATDVSGNAQYHFDDTNFIGLEVFVNSDDKKLNTAFILDFDKNLEKRTFSRVFVDYGNGYDYSIFKNIKFSAMHVDIPDVIEGIAAGASLSIEQPFLNVFAAKIMAISQPGNIDDLTHHITLIGIKKFDILSTSWYFENFIHLYGKHDNQPGAKKLLSTFMLDVDKTFNINTNLKLGYSYSYVSLTNDKKFISRMIELRLDF